MKKLRKKCGSDERSGKRNRLGFLRGAWMLGVFASAAVFACGCSNKPEMIGVAVIAGNDSPEAVSMAEEPIRIQLNQTEAVKETEPEPTTPPEPEIEDITLLFAGDVYFSNYVLSAYDKAGGIHGVLDEGIRAEIEAADIFMVNQEFPFTERGTQAADKQYTFRLPHSRSNRSSHPHIPQENGLRGVPRSGSQDRVL